MSGAGDAAARRWLVLGASGLLGGEVVAELAGRHVTTATSSEVDVRDAATVAAAVADHDVVVNCAGYTAVDDAESDEETAFAVNAEGAANVARACAASGVRLVHVSTGYVFAGEATMAYRENAGTRPRTAYGRSKEAGERAVLGLLGGTAYVVRTAWLYGERGSCFSRTMLRMERSRPTINVVDDQWGQPTWNRDVATRIRGLVESGAPPGIYHATAAGETTWYGFARALFEEIGADPGRISPTTSAAFPRPAARPAYTVLAHGNWERTRLPSPTGWREMLAAAATHGVFAAAEDG
ncbi:dTDP-4-dehydrorhamnose reductase [Salinactinospora qingdaonensis]|uniref:dTDP-4-dehydrorhamnose reductase n=1 Tax=Salinactinospora qingdaonensis TaxID=702744 RepID=A0ABP7FID7_9ACTN